MTLSIRCLEEEWNGVRLQGDWFVAGIYVLWSAGRLGFVLRDAKHQRSVDEPHPRSSPGRRCREWA